MKKNKIWKIIWVVGVYAILTTILYLVILYKVEWEHKDLNTYLYFYDCNDKVCSSSIVQNDYYSKIMCKDNICPYITDIIDNNLILKENDHSLIFDYINGRIIDNSYDEYKHLKNGVFVVTDKSKKQGIIDLNGEVLVDLQYDYIGDYNNGMVAYKKDNLYGIISDDGKNMVDAKFEDIVLINDSIYAGRENNVYHIYSYTNNEYVNSNKYNFLESYMDVIFVVNNKKIDILTTDLNSTLLLKIDTFYDYTTEKERDSLKLSFD